MKKCSSNFDFFMNSYNNEQLILIFIENEMHSFLYENLALQEQLILGEKKFSWDHSNWKHGTYLSHN